MDYTFTKTQLLEILAGWTTENFTEEELQFLHTSISKLPDTVTYGLDDPESYILELLDDFDNE